jgi:hypothetical protein
MADRQPPAVVLLRGDDASGMATMLAGLLEENLRDFPSRRRVAELVRGTVVLTAADRGLSVTLRFVSGAVQVGDGPTPGAPEVAGPWLTMTKLCSGQVSPVRAWRNGELRLDNVLRAPTAAAASFVLSVPSSFYGEVKPVRRAIIIGSFVMAALLAVVAAVSARRRHARGR